MGRPKSEGLSVLRACAESQSGGVGDIVAGSHSQYSTCQAEVTPAGTILGEQTTRALLHEN